MPAADPSLPIAERIDAACDRFEAESKAGGRPRIDDFLAAVPESDRGALRPALLAIELELQGCAAADTSVTRDSVRSEDKPSENLTVQHQEGVDGVPPAIGRFEIRGTLGSGAFGRVYRAHDPQLGREVAVKVPLEAAVATDAERGRFLKEARAAATINHPNVCQIHEVGESNGRPYIVMALVPGLSLAETIKGRTVPLAEKQSALVIRKVALALAAAHEKGIVHRDLKPANIMFDRERKDIVVMDFGLARGPKFGDARGTQSGVILGTPAYMSPEQARGGSKDVGPAGDIFSLGVILYELLTGTRPFSGTATEVIGQILHVEPEKPSQRRAGIDLQLEAVCLKAMAKEPSDRYASMKELAASIDAILRGPKPLSAPADTVQANKTRREGEASATSTNMADVFAAMSMDRRQARVETAAVVEAAVARARTPRWLFALLGLLFVGGLTTLAGIMFFTGSDKVKVTIELTDVDLADKTLSFFLDEVEIAADALANPIELKPGEHVLVVKRGKEIVKRMLLTVTGGRQPSIKVKDITPPSPFDPDTLLKGEWRLMFTPQYLSAIPSHYKRYRPRPPDGVMFENGTLIDTAKPPVRDVALRTRIERLGAERVSLGVRVCARGGYFAVWEGASFRIQRHDSVGGNVKKTELARIEAPPNAKGDSIDLAFAARGQSLYLFVNGRLAAEAVDAHFGWGYLQFGAGPGPAVLRRLETRPLEGPPIEQDRFAAARFLGHGARLTVDDGHSPPRDAYVLSDLPAGRFRTLGLQLNDARLGVVWKEDLKLLASLHDLRRFAFAGAGEEFASSELADTLRVLPNLRELELAKTAFTDADLEKLSGLSQLQSLRLEAVGMTDAGLASLKKLTGLKRLSLVRAPITDSGLATLAELNGLEFLSLKLTSISDQGIAGLFKLKSLRELAVDGTRVTAAGVQRLQAALPDCVVTPRSIDDSPDRQAATWTLSLGGAVKVAFDEEERQVSSISELPAGPIRLIGLELANKPISDADLGRLDGLGSLASLNLAGTKVTDAGVAKLKALRQLQNLNLFLTPIGPGALSHLKNLPELRTLNLAANHIGDGGWENLRGLAKLEQLDILNADIGDAGLAKLAGLPLLELRVARNQRVTATGLAHLAKMPRLQKLDLAENKGIDDGAVEHLRKLAGLTYLNLSETRVSSDGLARLRQALPKCQVVPAPADPTAKPPLGS